MFIFSLFNFELAAITLRPRNKFLQKYKLLTIYPFLSQKILQYDKTAWHIINMKSYFVATLNTEA